MTVYLIDGYNVLYALLQAEGRGASRQSMDLERERSRLVDRLASHMAGTSHRAVVVFDSKRARLERVESASKNVEVYFGSFSRSADAIIERVAYRLRRDETVVVVSSDYVLQQTVFSPSQERFPVVRASSAQFVAEMMEAARFTAKTSSGPGTAQRVEDRLPADVLGKMKALRDSLQDDEGRHG